MIRKLAFLLFVGSGVYASELASRITVPLPQLMKYADAAGACEAEGMQLARFISNEAIEYTTATLVQKNLDRVWIGSMGADERSQLALQVFEGVPIVFKVEQIVDADKMLAVLCEPKTLIVENALKSETNTELEESMKSETNTELEESMKELNVAQEAVTPINSIVNEDITEDDTKEVVICTFEVDNGTESVNQIDQNRDDEDDDNGIDLIKSKGPKSRRSSKCSRSSSSSEGYRRRRGYERLRGYHRRNRRYSRACSSSSSSSSSNCMSSFSCDPFCPTGSSSSSYNEPKCNRKSRYQRQKRRSCRKMRSSRGCRVSSSSSTSSSSSSDYCGTGRCGLGRTSKKFFREIRLSQRIN